MTFHVAERDYAVMAKALKQASVDPDKAREVVDALFADRHMLIDGTTYREMYSAANTHGPAD